MQRQGRRAIRAIACEHFMLSHSVAWLSVVADSTFGYFSRRVFSPNSVDLDFQRRVTPSDKPHFAGWHVGIERERCILVEFPFVSFVLFCSNIFPAPELNFAQLPTTIPCA